MSSVSCYTVNIAHRSTSSIRTRQSQRPFDKGPARIEMSGPHFLDINISVIIVRKQFATFLHIFLIFSKSFQSVSDSLEVAMNANAEQ